MNRPSTQRKSGRGSVPRTRGDQPGSIPGDQSGVSAPRMCRAATVSAEARPLNAVPAPSARLSPSKPLQQPLEIIELQLWAGGVGGAAAEFVHEFSGAVGQRLIGHPGRAAIHCALAGAGAAERVACGAALAGVTALSLAGAFSLFAFGESVGACGPPLQRPQLTADRIGIGP